MLPRSNPSPRKLHSSVCASRPNKYLTRDARDRKRSRTKFVSEGWNRSLPVRGNAFRSDGVRLVLGRVRQEDCNAVGSSRYWREPVIQCVQFPLGILPCHGHVRRHWVSP